MEKFVLVPASLLNKLNTTKSTTLIVDLPKFQPQQTPTSKVDSLKKDKNKKLFAKADTLVDKLLASPRMKVSLSNTIVLDGTNTGVLLQDFAQHLRRKNADVPNIYFSLLDAADNSATIVLNQNAEAKEKRNWIPFKIWATKSFKDYIHMVLQQRALCEIWQKLASYPFPRLDKFYIQKTLRQNLHLQHASLNAWEHLLDTRIKYGVWTWHMFLHWQRITEE